MMADKTRAARIEELLREAQEILADYCPGFGVIQDSIEMTLAMPPDPPSGDAKLRELRDIVDHYEFVMRDCPKPMPDGPWVVLTRLFAALHRLLD